MTGPALMNTVCPVCGTVIPDSMPPVAVEPHYRLHQQEDDDHDVPVAFRVCSEACAQSASADPGRYRRAASDNAVAGR